MDTIYERKYLFHRMERVQSLITNPVKFSIAALTLLLITGGLCGAKAQKSTAKIASNISEVPNNAYAAMRWRLVGPFRAGRALAACGISGNPRIFYFGAVDGGVWKTDNAGLTWKNITDKTPIASVGALAIAPSNPDIIYVGTGEADMRSDITYGTGVYKSMDGGKTWMHLGLNDSRHIGKILIDPTNPDIVLVAVLGHAYGPNTERGVYRTTDGGKTWQKVLYKGPGVGAVDLASDPNHPQVVFATLWNARRPPWSQYPPNEGPGSGIYKSTDGGKTWTHITGHGLPTGQLGRIGVSVAGNRVYALVEAKKQSGLYRSDDGGETWELVSNDPRITTRMWYFGRVFVDPENPNIVYIPNRSVMRSTDGGQTFTAIKGSPGGDDYHYAWVDPKNDHRIIVAADQGTTLSLDDGKTWSSWYNQPTAQFYHVVTDNSFPYHIYGAQQDAGSVGILSRSNDGEITFRDWHPVGSGESGYIAVNPNNPRYIYGGDTYGGVYRYDSITGQVQNISPSPVSEWPMPPITERKYRFTWTSPIVFDPLNYHTLYLGAQVVLRTQDGGLHWNAISPDLTGARKINKSEKEKVTVKDAASLHYGVVYSIAPSPVHEGTIWAGTDDGYVWVTMDGGHHWQDVTPKGLKSWSKISLIDASPFNAGTAYIAVDRHRLDDFKPYIYRTTDYGKSWTQIDQGIPDGSFVRAIRADPKQPGLLYAGTERGVYVSFDNGNHWQSLQLNLPIASVRDLSIRDNDLIVATHGRAFWVLDDLTPLRQMSESVLNAEVHLFQPAKAYRMRRDVSTDTPLPPEIPHGTNPPAGAIVDYYLKTQPRGPVTLEILDDKGHVVHRFSSDNSPEPSDAKTYFARQWLPIPHVLPSQDGLNRFVWNLRYPRPEASGYGYSIAAIAGEGTVKVPQGPLVLPGKYTVKLLADGRSMTQSLVIKMDPRVSVTSAALKDQLQLALKIWNDMAVKQSIRKELKSTAGQLDMLKQSKSFNAKTVAMIDSLSNRVQSVSRALGGGAFASLESDVESADRQPTSQVHEAFIKLDKELHEQQQIWAEIVSKQIPVLNDLLRRQMTAGITIDKIIPAHLDMPE